MNLQQNERMQHDKGFVAALDQSGGSTPKALEHYGIPANAYSSKEEMFDLVHKMRTRIIKSPVFTSEQILAVILFEQTMDRTIDGMPTGYYLWEKKGIVPFLKVDKGLETLENGVQLMIPIDDLDDKLKRAANNGIFGTKMRSVIKSANPEGIRSIVDQQFEYGIKIAAAGFVPIIEPEVDIHSEDKAESEVLLKENIIRCLNDLPQTVSVMLKLSIPTVDNFYADLIANPKVLRVVALSGGYSREEADEHLKRNNGLIASFSRALLEGLSDGQTDEEFNATLAHSLNEIYQASIT